MSQPTVLVDIKPEEVKKPFLSHSVWQAYLECPALFYFQYILKIPEKRSSALALGTAWDEALTFYAKEKLERAEPTADHMAAAFASTYDMEMQGIDWNETEIFTPGQREKLLRDNDGEIPYEEREHAEKIARNFWREWGIRNVLEYVKQVGPTVRPKYVQKWFFIDFGEDVPFGYKGMIDRVDEDGTVVDNKTSKSRWSERDVSFDLQCVGYALAYRILEQQAESGIRYDILVKTKTQSFSERFQQIGMKVEAHRMQLLLAEISAIFRNISSGNLYRRVHGFSGKCSYCNFQPLCWSPHEQWSRQPTREEIAQYLEEMPDAHETLKEWTQAFAQQKRLINFEEAGAELRRAIQRNPMILTFWY